MATVTVSANSGMKYFAQASIVAFPRIVRYWFGEPFREAVG